MIKIAMIGIAGMLLALQLKALRPEYSVFVCLGVSLLIFLAVTDQLADILAGIRMVEEALPIHVGYIQTLVKIIGVTYIAEFASDLCKDAGYQTIAGQIQIFGKLTILTVSIPVFTALLDMIQTFSGG